jgi:hypothetical protein
MKDTFSNLVAGFGTWKDKAMAQVPYLQVLELHQLKALYRGDWISRKVVDIPAFDSTRAWRQWQADKEVIKLLENTEKSFGMQHKLYMAMVKARLYGGSAIVLGVDDGQDFGQELDLNRCKKDCLKFAHVVERWMISPGPVVKDITSPWFGSPSYYMRSNTPVISGPDGVDPIPLSSLSEQAGATIYIHPSRVIRMIGMDYPDMEEAPDAWGDSALQIVYEAIRGAGMVNSSVASMIAEAKLDVIMVDGLSNKLSTTAGTQKVMDRYANANAAKSVLNMLLLEKDQEEWIRKELRLTGMDKVQQTYLMICAAASDIPVTRFLGQSPAGMDATGESDTRNYYDRINSEQKLKVTPTLTPLDEVMIRHSIGTRDPDIDYSWNPLWQLSDNDKAKNELALAQAHQVDVGAGIINPEVLREGRINYLMKSDTLYLGLEAAVDDYGTEPDEEEVPEEPENAISDSSPAPLCVTRSVLNTAELKAWARSQGFRSIVADPHVTVLYSKQPVDWMKMGRSRTDVVIPEGEPRVVEPICPGGPVVLHVSCPELSWRHDQLVREGASHDYPEYQPHVTITYEYEGVDLEKVTPFRGEIKLGPERFSRVDETKPFEVNETMLKSGVRR